MQYYLDLAVVGTAGFLCGGVFVGMRMRKVLDRMTQLAVVTNADANRWSEKAVYYRDMYLKATGKAE